MDKKLRILEEEFRVSIPWVYILVAFLLVLYTLAFPILALMALMDKMYLLLAFVFGIFAGNSFISLYELADKRQSVH